MSLDWLGGPPAAITKGLLGDIIGGLSSVRSLNAFALDPFEP